VSLQEKVCHIHSPPDYALRVVGRSQQRLLRLVQLLAAALLLAGAANAKVIEKTFPVRGHCGMCKNRIETVAKGFDGVQDAAYDLKAQSLKLTYESRQVRPNKVLKAIKALPDRQREVLILRTLEGLSYEEIARRTGMNELTLRVLLSRARSQLKKIR